MSTTNAAKIIHQVEDLPTRERSEDGSRSIRLERVPGGWLITIDHPEWAIHTDGSRSRQPSESFRIFDERQAFARYAVLAQVLGAEVEVGEDGRSITERAS